MEKKIVKPSESLWIISELSRNSELSETLKLSGTF